MICPRNKYAACADILYTDIRENPDELLEILVRQPRIGPDRR